MKLKYKKFLNNSKAKGFTKWITVKDFIKEKNKEDKKRNFINLFTEKLNTLLKNIFKV